MNKIPLLAAVLLLSACSLNSLPGFLRPHSVDIQQGNVVTQDVVDKLRVGMSRSQVRFLLGTPLLTDMFHANRWDYTYQLYRNGQELEQKRFTVYFEADQLSRWEGDVFPARRPALNAAEPAAPAQGQAQ